MNEGRELEEGEGLQMQKPFPAPLPGLFIGAIGVHPAGSKGFQTLLGVTFSVTESHRI
jgi:hypothetical protein